LRMALSTWRVTTVPFLVTIHAFDDEPSVTKPCLSTNQASWAPCSRAACLASTLGNSDTDLMSTRAQRVSGTEITATPSAARFSTLTRSRLRAVTTMLGRVLDDGNAKSRRDTPRV